MSRPVLGAPRGMTSLGRSVDLNYPSNVFAVAGSAVAGTLAFGVSLGDGFPTAAAGGIVVGLAAFVAWAIGRELDPDHPAAAAVALVIAGAAALFDRPALLAVFGVLLAARLAVGSTGLRPTPIDRAVLVAVAVALGTQAVAWPALVVLVVAIVMRGKSIALPLSMAVVGAAGAIVLAEAPEWTVPDPWQWAFLGAALVSGVAGAALASAPTSMDDLGAPIALGALRAARVAAVLAVAGTGALLGGSAAGAMAPVSGALIAACCTSLLRNRARA